jgi:hypothetical protein
MTLPQPPSLCVGLLKPFFKVVAQKGSLSGKKKKTKKTTTTTNTTTTTTTTTPMRVRRSEREREKKEAKRGDLQRGIFLCGQKVCLKPGVGEHFVVVVTKSRKRGPYFFEVVVHPFIPTQYVSIGIKVGGGCKKDTQKGANEN